MRFAGYYIERHFLNLENYIQHFLYETGKRSGYPIAGRAIP